MRALAQPLHPVSEHYLFFAVQLGADWFWIEERVFLINYILYKFSLPWFSASLVDEQFSAYRGDKFSCMQFL